MQKSNKIAKLGNNWDFKLYKKGNSIVIVDEPATEHRRGQTAEFRLNKGILEYKRNDIDINFIRYKLIHSSAEPALVEILKMLGLREQSAKQLIKEQVTFYDKTP